MYIFLRLKDNNLMVTAFVIVALVLLLPITNDIYLYFDFKIKKPVFLIKIWGVKLLGG